MGSAQAGRLRPTKRAWVFEPTLLVILSAFLAWFGYRYGGQVFGTDTLLYIDTGLRGIADPFILHRYTHVFALRVASLLAGTPLGGMQLYSGAALAGGTLLVYFAARSFNPEASVPHAVLAAGLFLANGSIFDQLMAPLVDTTAMLAILAAILVYLLYRRSPSRVLLLLFGFLFYAALRTKETSIILLILLPGLLWDRGSQTRLRGSIKSLAGVAAGFLLGAGLHILANALLLGDALFGFRLSDYRQFLAIWSDTIGSAAKAGSSFEALVLAENGLFFVLYFAAGVLRSGKKTMHEALLWVYPLALVVMLIVFSTRTAWQIVPRGFLPGLGVMCVLGAQILPGRDKETGRDRRDQLKNLIPLILLGLLAVFGLRSHGAVGYATYFRSLALPVLFLGIIVALLLYGPPRRLISPFSLLVAPALIGLIGINFGAELMRPAGQNFNRRFEPLLAFESEFRAGGELKMFVSESVLPSLAIQPNRDELQTLMNTGLNIESARDDYTIGTVGYELVEQLARGEYTHVLLTAADYRHLLTMVEDEVGTPDRLPYEVKLDPSQEFVLLVLDDLPGSMHMKNGSARRAGSMRLAAPKPAPRVTPWVKLERNRR